MAWVWNLQKKTFALSMLAGTGQALSGPQAQLQAAYNEALATDLSAQTHKPGFGTCSIDWGGCIFQHPGASAGEDGESKKSDYIDNAMVVFKGSENGETVYVVAIAGTNPHSDYDIMSEDLDVGTHVQWPGGRPTTWISRGTDTGLHNLLNMPYSSDRPTLAAYLQALPGRAASTLIFAGHSLGGALAPTLALRLFGPGGQLAISDWKRVLVFPTAGPSPGNQEFADLFAQSFPPIAAGTEGGFSWNTLVKNTLDVVPHAFQADTMPDLPTLYGKQIDQVRDIVGTLLVLAGPDYRGLGAQTFSHSEIGEVTTFGEYVFQLGIQHITAYTDEFGFFGEDGPGTPAEHALVAGVKAAVQKRFEVLQKMAKARARK
jgi:hypothetical protein